MPRERNENRKKSFELWLKSNGEKPLKEIAAELGVSYDQVRSWKAMDKWIKRVHIKEEPKTGKLVMRRNTGAPPGTRNAVGNHGGAPKGNQNHFIHGAYSKVMKEILTGRELEIFNDLTAGEDLEAELRSTLAALNAREAHLTARIEELKAEAAKQSTIENLESRITTDYQEETGIFVKGVRVQGTGFYDGKKSTTTVKNRPAIFDSLNKLETELNFVHGRKIKVLSQLETLQYNRQRLELERKKMDGENEQSKIANAWIAALTGGEVPRGLSEEVESNAD